MALHEIPPSGVSAKQNRLTCCSGQENSLLAVYRLLLLLSKAVMFSVFTAHLKSVNNLCVWVFTRKRLVGGELADHAAVLSLAPYAVFLRWFTFPCGINRCCSTIVSKTQPRNLTFVFMFYKCNSVFSIPVEFISADFYLKWLTVKRVTAH